MTAKQILSPNEENISKACATLRVGGLVAMPTETVYGLAGDACNDHAIAEIFALKGRPSFNPLIIHTANFNQAYELAIFPLWAKKLAEIFWPGPLTMVVPRRDNCPISLLASAGLPSIALRVPAHPVAQKLLNKFSAPLAAPSANRSGRISPTCAIHVAEELELSIILDGGDCELGVESTIIDCTAEVPVILRPGSITIEMLQAIIPASKELASAEQIASPTQAPKIIAPGMLTSHYAPNIPVRLNAQSGNVGEALLGFGKIDGNLNLSPTGDLKEAAANLFAYLRQLDSNIYSAIAVAPIPHKELGIAINDRLNRAAAPRK